MQKQSPLNQEGLVLFGPLIEPCNVNEGILRNLLSSNITGTSPSDFLMSCPGHSFGVGSYPSAEVQSVYSTDWAMIALSSYEIVCN